MNIIIHDPGNLLERQFLSISDDRFFYENDHIEYKEKLDIITPKAVSFYSYLQKFTKFCVKSSCIGKKLIISK